MRRSPRRACQERLTTTGTDIGRFFYKQGVSLATGLVRFVIGFLVWVIVLYYLFVDGPRFGPGSATPSRCRRTSRTGSAIDSSAWPRRWWWATEPRPSFRVWPAGLVFAALDLPGPVLWGVAMGILAFIPVVGISFVYMPAWAMLMLIGDSARAFSLLIPLAVLATIVEYWLKPLLVGGAPTFTPCWCSSRCSADSTPSARSGCCSVL